MYVVMNRFKVNAGREADFEARWRERETYLGGFDGFIQFALLRNSQSAGGITEFVSHTIWRDQAAFDAWRNSEAFTQGHAQGTVQGVLAGHPEASMYDAVIVETSAGASVA
jgi:heme-degrading monooxygenase HmoA